MRTIHRLSRTLFVGMMAVGLQACASTGVNAPQTSSATTAARPKNVILFVGDGMGISTITAARIYDAQTRGEQGEENLLSFEHFPNVALVKTYNTDQQVPDSAGTASALNTGVKTRAGVIDIGPQAHRGSCAEAKAHIQPNVAELAKRNGLAVGIVTTTRLTHATPAAVYAHSADREWESDADMPETELGAGCADIASQLVDFPFDVALGGGSEKFAGTAHGGDRRVADADLVATWQKRTGGHYVTTKAEMVGTAADDRPLLGIFGPSHLTYMLDRKPEETEPTLSEMTVAAIDRLSRDHDGYFLMVEGGRIDHGHHAGRAAYALSETQEFARAVTAALAKVDLKDTLVLVTADHSHVFGIAGYPTKGNPILGLVQGNDEHGEPTGKPTLATDGKPYTTLGYLNGPGAVSGERPAPSTDPLAHQQSLVPTGDIFNGTHNLSETHGGEDVALYATGATADSVRGVIEQNVVFQYIVKALGIGG